ncbi:nitroreductase/quinone reductase family protein [Nocardia fusca]|uniref:nitroreductase/quinone reductase family protein n=1 Tax=Nocardia fusca TaxID=941183 RepID=UPI001E3C90BC|nr:nitroreductase/quinone reductase family protein [Nocardia fusca]
MPTSTERAVFGTHGGSPHHPAWYRNLMANPRVTVEAGPETAPAVARLAEGAERERIWAEEIALVPKFAEFEAAAGGSRLRHPTSSEHTDKRRPNSDPAHFP